MMHEREIVYYSRATGDVNVRRTYARLPEIEKRLRKAGFQDTGTEHVLVHPKYFAKIREAKQ